MTIKLYKMPFKVDNGALFLLVGAVTLQGQVCRTRPCAEDAASRNARCKLFLGKVLRQTMGSNGVFHGDETTAPLFLFTGANVPDAI